MGTSIFVLSNKTGICNKNSLDLSREKHRSSFIFVVLRRLIANFSLRRLSTPRFQFSLSLSLSLSRFQFSLSLSQGSRSIYIYRSIYFCLSVYFPFLFLSVSLSTSNSFCLVLPFFSLVLPPFFLFSRSSLSAVLPSCLFEAITRFPLHLTISLFFDSI